MSEGEKKIFNWRNKLIQKHNLQGHTCTDKDAPADEVEGNHKGIFRRQAVKGERLVYNQ